MVGVIYKVTNISNEKVYIGQTTKDLEERKRNHLRSSHNSSPKYLFHKALKKYGELSFLWEVIDIGYNKDDLNAKEKWWISYYNSLACNNGYNLSDGGSNNSNPYAGKTKEEIKISKDKWKETLLSHGGFFKERNPFYGRHHSQETKKLLSEQRKNIPLPLKTREKIGKSQKNKKVSSVTKKKISNSLKGRYKGKDSPNYGTHKSLEERKLISERSQGEKNNSAKKVLCIETNEIFTYMGLGAEKIYGDKKFYWCITRSIKQGKKIKQYSWQYV